MSTVFRRCGGGLHPLSAISMVSSHSSPLQSLISSTGGSRVFRSGNHPFQSSGFFSEAPHSSTLQRLFSANGYVLDPCSSISGRGLATMLPPSSATSSSGGLRLLHDSSVNPSKPIVDFFRDHGRVVPENTERTTTIEGVARGINNRSATDETTETADAYLTNALLNGNSEEIERIFKLLFPELGHVSYKNLVRIARLYHQNSKHFDIPCEAIAEAVEGARFSRKATFQDVLHILSYVNRFLTDRANLLMNEEIQAKQRAGFAERVSEYGLSLKSDHLPTFRFLTGGTPYDEPGTQFETDSRCRIAGSWMDWFQFGWTGPILKPLFILNREQVKKRCLEIDGTKLHIGLKESNTLESNEIGDDNGSTAGVVSLTLDPALITTATKTHDSVLYGVLLIGFPECAITKNHLHEVVTHCYRHEDKVLAIKFDGSFATIYRNPQATARAREMYRNACNDTPLGILDKVFRSTPTVPAQDVLAALKTYSIWVEKRLSQAGLAA